MRALVSAISFIKEPLDSFLFTGLNTLSDNIAFLGADLVALFLK